METNRISVLYLASWFPYPGKENHGIFVKKHAEVISGYCTVNVVNFIFEQHAGNELIIEKINDNFKVFHIYMEKSGLPGGRLIDLIRMNILFYKHILKSNIIRFDVIHLNVVYHLGVTLSLYLLTIKKPLIITEHWTGYFVEDGRYFSLPGYMKRIVKKIFRKANRVVAISQSMSSKLNDLFDTGNKTVVIPNVLNCPDTAVIAKRKPGTHFRFLVIANFDDRQKGISGIIDAFLSVLKQHPDATLTLAGGGIDYESIKNYAMASSGKAMIRFTGNLPNAAIPGLYLDADCYVMNSNFETFSIATAEALLYGLPVIATKCNGPEEYVHSGNGMLIERNNIIALTEAMTQIFQLRSNYNSIQIQQEMKEKYCRDIGKRFNEVYKEVLNIN